ncbi:translation initiation factor 2A, partial [Tremellales sp. Uapishka_1]
MAAQYAIRAQKTSGIAESPSWELTSKIPVDTAAVKCYAYSPNGEWFAYAVASCVHLLSTSSSDSAEPRIVELPNVVNLCFSPLSTTLFTYERPIKSDTDVHQNVKGWSVEDVSNVSSWYQKTMDGWYVIPLCFPFRTPFLPLFFPSLSLPPVLLPSSYFSLSLLDSPLTLPREPIITPTESHLIRATNSDLLIFSPALAPKPSIRLKVDGAIKGLFLSAPFKLANNTPPAVNAHPEPALAVWIGERKGAPATVAIYTLSVLLGNGGKENGEVETRDMPMTMARKSFYKADKLNVKWNNAGTMALFLTHTDVDNTGKSYYGETNLYLASVDGSFDGMVELDKEGPIYDFNWNPTSREFSVCYGYMPARTQVFDNKAKAVHSFGSGHRNFLSYQPQGKLLLSAGFGNLAGGVDIWDVSTRKKVAEFKAANASHCEWSPCGRYILTATLSPRLRVDNRVIIWWCGGQLLHIHPQDELYQASFMPKAVTDVASFPASVPPAPEPNASVTQFRPKGESSSNGDAKPAGAYRPPGARGALAPDIFKQRDDDSSPSSTSGASTPLTPSAPGFRGGKPAGRYIPGAPPPGSAPVVEEKKKKTRTKNGKKEKSVEESLETLKVEEPVVAETNGEEEAVQKKIRNLTKKLKAIDELKMRRDSGEALEKTQLKKIDAESAVKAEISSLGGSF